MAMTLQLMPRGVNGQSHTAPMPPHTAAGNDRSCAPLGQGISQLEGHTILNK